jgi:inosose dehydratase
MPDLLNRIAGAPITWGVDGSPGWGHLMDSDRVLAEMVEVGLTATELGPDGYLPTDSDELREYLRPFGLSIVGGFVPAVLHRPDRIDQELDYVERASRQLASSGSKVMVLGPASHHPGYDTPMKMDEEGWKVFLLNLERLQRVAGDHGLTTALHPHVGMAIERQDDVERLLESSDVDLCVDTGHLFLAGADPVDITRLAGDRVRHVHLKDVDEAGAARVRNGEVPFRQAVIDGLFKPVGHGDVDIDGVIRSLESIGYDGWYVLEQDCALSADPPPGDGPIDDARASYRTLEEIAGRL